MSNKSFKIRKSAVIIPEASPSLTQQGEIAYDSVTDKLQVRDASTTDAVVLENKAQTLDAKTLENSTIDADLNTITNIDNADIKAGAAIEVAKLEALTASRALETDGSGVIQESAVTSTELGHLSGVTSAIQTQLDGKVDEVASTDNAAVRFDGITGSLQDSSVIIDDLAAISGVTQLDVDNLRLDGNTLSSTDTNGNILLSPDGTGSVSIESTALQLTEISTPATPASGYRKIYPKADGKLYQLNDAGVEVEVGSGAGGGINYIGNSDAESNTDGWVTYADGSATPVDGTGGSPTLTWTRSTSSPLFDAANFLLTPGALGNGVSYDFTIDSALQAKVLEGTLYYEIATPGSYTDGDVTFWIYDVTNATLIQPSVYQLARVIGPAQHRFEFQTAVNSTSYRLLVHQATSATGYSSIKLDNFSISPNKLVNGVVTTATQTYTPTVSNLGTGSTTVNTGWYRFDGDQADVRISFVKDGSAGTGTSTVGWTVPPGAAIDTTKATAVGGVYFVGFAHVFDIASISSNIIDRAYSVYYNVGLGVLNITRPGSTGELRGQDIEAGAQIVITASWPVQGKSAVAILGQDADIRVLAGQYVGAGGGNQTLTANVTNITFGTKEFDKTGTAFSAGVFTCPIAGVWEFAVGLYQITSSVDVYWYKNGVTTNRVAFNAVATETNNKGFARFELNAGDTLSLRAAGNSTASDSAVYNSFSFARISGPAQIAASEFVKCRVTPPGTQNIVTTAATVIDFSAKTYDSHNAFDLSTERFVAPITGDYRVQGCVASGTTLTAGQVLQIAIRKNGTNYSLFYQYATGANEVQTPFDDLVPLNAGDYIDITAQSADGNYTIAASGLTFLTVEKRNT